MYLQLKQELQKHSGWQAKRLCQRLIEEEKDLDALMEFVRVYPDCIEQYANDLVDVYQEDIRQIYKQYINAAANHASNRKGYQDVCRKIRRYESVVGQLLQQEIVNELRELYRRKPAFVDELGKV